jgi:glycosyltransferase involved in cell wall biosynthesis
VRARLALNALALRPGGSGVQTYIRELLRVLPAAVDADVVALVQADVVGELPPGVTARVRPVASGLRRAAYGLSRMGGVDLVHGLNVAIPRAGAVPRVTTIHDLAVFDVPWAFPRASVAAKRALYRRAIRSADAVIGVSPFTAERIEARFHRRATVTMEAPPSDCTAAAPELIETVRARYELPDAFVLHVGTVEPRKDVPGLARACEAIGVPLVLAGATPSGTAGIRAHALGYVPRADLLALYGAARVVAYPSRYEGFGLPVVEAMACGAAVITTSVASLAEVVGDGALVVPPEDPDALAGGLRDLWNDPDRRREMRAAGIQRAASMRWEATAGATAAVYRELGVSV